MKEVVEDALHSLAVVDEVVAKEVTDNDGLLNGYRRIPSCYSISRLTYHAFVACYQNFLARLVCIYLSARFLSLRVHIGKPEIMLRAKVQ